jgi:pilus assembly protein CpaD
MAALTHIPAPGALAKRPAFGKGVWTGLVLAATLMVSACVDPSEPYRYEAKEQDYRQRHAITVESTVARNWIIFAADQKSLTAADTDKLYRYFSDYVVAGHGPVTARLATQNLTLAVRNARLSAVRRIAREQGLRPDELEVVMMPVIPTPKGPVDLELGFIRYIAGLPDCPDWSKNVDDNTANSTHSNFGCATQSNFGAMLVDPADLLRPRKSRAPDGATVDNRIRTKDIPRTHPKKGVGTISAGAPVRATDTGTGSAPAPEGGSTAQTTPAAGATD